MVEKVKMRSVFHLIGYDTTFSPSCLYKFLQKTYSLFQDSHLLFLIRRVFRFGFRHTFIRFCKCPESFVVVLILINFHLKQNKVKQVFHYTFISELSTIFYGPRVANTSLRGPVYSLRVPIPFPPGRNRGGGYRYKYASQSINI